LVVDTASADKNATVTDESRIEKLISGGRYHMSKSSEFERYFQGVRDIQRAVYTRTRVKEVLDVVVTKSTEILSAKGALIRILNKEANQFEVRAAYGMGNKYLHKGPVSTEKLLSDIKDFHSVKLIKDIWSAPRVEYPQLAWDEGIRMMLDVPLAIGDRLLGLMRIYLEKERDFSDSELDFIITIAEQCTGIIERVQLLENQRADFTHLAVHVDKMSSLGRMAAGIAHEINNPLAGILLYSSNMRKKVQEGGLLDQSLKIIMNETQRCKTIIQGLLDFARDTEPNKLDAYINNIMDTAIGIVENEFRLKHVQIQKNLSENITQTLLDENQILQVFINILLNALEAVEENGTVTVLSRMDKKRRKITIEVEDNGSGIAPDNIQKIFDPFFSTKTSGTGLGLAVSYGIIQNHEGDIRAYSELGKGARFVVEVPILHKPSQDEESR
jgi:signal transduction histidine kinase